MNTDNKILGNQLVVLSRSDLDTMVNEMAQNIVAAQTRNMQNDSEAGIDAPEGMRFITRKETASLLHVNYTTLWRWNNNAPSADSLLLYNSVGQMWVKMTKQKSQVLHF